MKKTQYIEPECKTMNVIVATELLIDSLVGDQTQDDDDNNDDDFVDNQFANKSVWDED